MILLKRGRVASDGAKDDMLTAHHLGHAFDASLQVNQAGGYYHVRLV